MPFLAAIDGPCGAGKSTFAQWLEQNFSCTVLHIDNYFLQPHQRTPERLAEPGGNVDRERFLQEVLIPLKEGRTVLTLHDFDCSRMCLGPAYTVQVKETVIIEGSYCCHPALAGHYDCRIFLDVDPATQLQRIAARNPEHLERFQTNWIPLENSYFHTFHIKENADLCLEV